VVKSGQVFSRIHRDDIVSAIIALSQRPEAAGIYNLADDEPASSHLVTLEAARLLGLPAPPLQAFDAAALSPMAQRFWAECKRVPNARAKARLGWHPQFPTYREGLAACLAASRS
jgi:nucleoside-diphosphate-sugar epimerase